MSCYIRHLKDILEEAGIEVKPANKKDIDRALHEIVGVTYKDCPGAWRSLKKQMADDAGRAALVRKLQKAMAK